jgi:DNA invertase Pin-like site-specific DNA recombinase
LDKKLGVVRVTTQTNIEGKIIGEKWAGYLRVSTGGQSIEVQREQIGRFLAGHPEIEIQWFGESESTRKTRPIKEFLIGECQRGKFRGVVFAKLDRWARSSTELVMDFDKLSARQVAINSIGDLGLIDPKNSYSRFTLQILGALAELERDLIRERTMEGLLHAKAIGHKSGRPKGTKDKKQRTRRTKIEVQHSRY